MYTNMNTDISIHVHKHAILYNICGLFGGDFDLAVGLGNISIYHQYHNKRVCNNRYRRLLHMSIILLMQYITEYCNI